MRSVILTKTLRRCESKLFIYGGRVGGRERILGRRDSLCKDPEVGACLVQESDGAQVDQRSEDGVGRIRLGDSGAHLQARTLSREGGDSLTACLWGGSLNSHLSSKEEYLLLTFS